jgi:hypothetical protein
MDSKTDWAAFGYGKVGQPCEDRPGRPHQPTFGGHDLFEVPAQDLREREQPQGLSSRGTVDNNHVVGTRACVVVDFEKGKQLVHAREDEELLGLDSPSTPPVEDVHQLTANRAPVTVELALSVDLLGMELIDNGRRVGSKGDCQSIGQRVCRVGRCDQGSIAGVSRGKGCRSCHGGLPHPTLSGDEDDSHCLTGLEGTAAEPPQCSRDHLFLGLTA